MRKLIFTLLLGLLGVALLLAGLGVDAYLHSHDETLAAREGVFTLSNPGHAMLALGMALTCASIFGAIYIAWGLAKPDGILGRRWLRIISMQTAGLASVAAIGFALTVSAEAHDHEAASTAAAASSHPHADDDDAHASEGRMAADVDPLAPLVSTDDAMHGMAEQAPPEGAASPAGQASPEDANAASAGTTVPAQETTHQHESAATDADAMMDAMADDAVADDAIVLADSNMHDHEMEQAGQGIENSHPGNHPQPTADELACLSDLTAQAKELTARLADYDAAVAEGYRLPAQAGGTHYPNPAYQRDGTVFDLAHPESAIYRTRDDGNRVLVGVLYHAPVGQGPTPCGNATWWHTHPKCVNLTTRERLDAGPDGACPEGTIFREGRVEMLHLWFVPRRAMN